MKTQKSYWIKERHNPQFDTPYYVACGQLSKSEAKRKGSPLYGSINMLEYKTRAEYLQAMCKHGLYTTKG